MNYIVIATPTKAGEPTKYVAGTRGSGYLTEDINEAARFVQATSAQAAIRGLRTSDFERRQNVTLSYGRIQTVVVQEFAEKPPASKPGYIIKFEDGKQKQYSSCPRNPKELTFQHVCYSRVENIDKATRYKTQAEAEARIKELLEVLTDTAAKMGGGTYQRILETFKATVVKV